MRISTDRINYAIIGSICEAAVLVIFTCMLIGFYLYESGSAPSVFPGLIGLGILMLVVYIFSVAASYYQNEVTQRKGEHATFKINWQLTATLRAAQVPNDIIVGLREMVQFGELTITGESQFLALLDARFGRERSKEVKSMVLRYARVEGPPMLDMDSSPPSMDPDD